jgi:hypothetical protein
MKFKLFCGIVLAFAFAGTALAQPAYLTCQDGSHLVFDESAGTAGFQHDTPALAEFSSNHIRWNDQEKRGNNAAYVTIDYELSRRSGDFTQSYANTTGRTTCEVGTEQPKAKF